CNLPPPRPVRGSGARGSGGSAAGTPPGRADGRRGMGSSDIRIAVRTLVRRPAFGLMVVLMLDASINATTALFGVFRAAFLQPLPLPDASELVVVMQTASFGCCGPASGPDYLDWVARQRSFEGMAALSPGFVNLTGLDEPERIYATRVTPSAFPLLGVEPLLGRSLTPDDTDADVVLLSHALWRDALGSRADAVGSSIEI